jgi:hypothetical protein
MTIWLGVVTTIVAVAGAVIAMFPARATEPWALLPEGLKMKTFVICAALIAGISIARAEDNAPSRSTAIDGLRGA